MPSTVIASIEHNAETHVLKIKFVSGLQYEYKNVPVKVYDQLRTSKLKGIYFNKHIKGRYIFEKVK